MCCYYCAIQNIEDKIDWAYVYIEEENIEFYEWLCPACIEHNEKDLGVQIPCVAAGQGYGLSWPRVGSAANRCRAAPAEFRNPHHNIHRHTY